jgi:glyceraldehyde 3-phosphate dehydrogenase
MQKKKSKPRIVINGLGRIGRIFLRIALNNPNFEIVAAHSRSGLENYAHLIKYDSAYGIWEKNIYGKDNNLYIDKFKLPFVQAEKDGSLPWKKIGADIVIDATGKYTKRQDAQQHLDFGAKYLVATAPMDDADETLVFGINHKKFDAKKHKIVSAGSCTTVCSSLVTKVLEENFGVKQVFINTVHAVTNDQQLLDSSHKDLRRARAATQSIIPTTTGVSKTIVKLYPHLQGKVSAMSLRVPVLNPSVVSFTAVLKTKTTKEILNKAFETASKSALKNHLGACNLPLVSVDFRGNSNGAVVDMLATEVVDGELVNILAWYDNEWGYVQQMVYVIEHLAKNIK